MSPQHPKIFGVYARPELTQERLESIMCQAITKNLRAKMPLREAVIRAGRWILHCVIPNAISEQRLSPERIRSLVQEVMDVVDDELELPSLERENIKGYLHHSGGQHLLAARVHNKTLLLRLAT